MWTLESSFEKPEATYRLCSLSPPPSLLPVLSQKFLPEQKHFAALSSEWLNNDRKSDSSSSSRSVCLSSDMIHGCDTLKPLLWIRLCTRKRTEESGSAWQMVSLNGGPKHLRDVAKSFLHRGWIAKNLSWKNFGQSSEVIFPFWGSAHLADEVWQKFQPCNSYIYF